MKMKILTQADFDPLLNNIFKLELEDGGNLELRLTEVNPGSERIRAQYEPGERAPFSLVFRGPIDALLQQRMYRLEHPAVGPLEIFLVPIGPDKQTMGYEAVFG